jgi:uncharacterized small protein (DUF1192 family)
MDAGTDVITGSLVAVGGGLENRRGSLPHAPEKMQPFRGARCRCSPALDERRGDVTIGSAAANVWRREPKMAAIEDEDRPKKKLAHEIGQDLALLSVEELGERIALMQGEIARLEAERARKQASRSAADQFFKR